MTETITATTWVYVLIQNPGSNEQIVGQHDSKDDISYIPIFLSKEAAAQGSLHMVKEKGQKYEVQAIIYEDLEPFAAKGGFILFVVDEEGRVMEQVVPKPVS